MSGCSGLTADGFGRLAAMRALRRLALRNAWLSAERVAPLAALSEAGSAVSAGSSGAAASGSTAVLGGADAWPDEWEEGEDGAGGDDDGSDIESASSSDGDSDDGDANSAAEPRRRRAPPPRRQHLAALRLEHCTGVDAGVADVVARLPRLRTLILRDCPDLAEPALLRLAAAPRLVRLEVRGCARAGAGARAAARCAREAAVAAVAAARRAGSGGKHGGGDDDCGGGGGAADRTTSAMDVDGDEAAAMLLDEPAAAAAAAEAASLADPPVVAANDATLSSDIDGRAVIGGVPLELWPAVPAPLDIVWEGALGEAGGDAGGW